MSNHIYKSHNKNLLLYHLVCPVKCRRKVFTDEVEYSLKKTCEEIGELFRLHPEVRNILWGGQFWTSGYYVNTVGQYANEKVIQQYVKNQGKVYKQIHKEQLRLL